MSAIISKIMPNRSWHTLLVTAAIRWLNSAFQLIIMINQLITSCQLRTHNTLRKLCTTMQIIFNLISTYANNISYSSSGWILFT